MKIYVASSWKTPRHAEVVEALRKEGYEVYDYREANQAFTWDEIAPDHKSWRAEDCIWATEQPIATKAYNCDFEALVTADVVVGVQPFGASAGLELGWAAGNGRETFLLAADGCPELMSNMLAHRAADLDTLLSMIAGWKLVCDQRNAFEQYTMTRPFFSIEREERPFCVGSIPIKNARVTFDVFGPEMDACFAELAKLFSKYSRTIGDGKGADRIAELETVLQSICKECEIKDVFSDECTKCNVKLALEGKK